MWKFLTVLVQATILFLSISASAQTTPDAQEILKKVNETYRNLKSYSFEYKTVFESTTEREGLTSTTHNESLSRITAVRPNRLRAETKDSNSTALLIADGQSVWMYSSQMNAYTKQAAGTVDVFAETKSANSYHENMARLASAKLAAYARLTAAPRNITLLPNETVTVDGRQIQCYVLSIAQGAGSLKSNARYWIDGERYLVLRESMDQTFRNGPGGVTQSMNLVNFLSAAINEPAPDSVFSYAPPEGAMEIDRLDPEALTRRRNAPVSWIGQAAPDFTLTDLNGKSVSLQSLRGKAVLLNFWATWCGPCVVEMPHLEKLNREYKNKGVVILGVDDEEAEVAQDFLKRHGYTFNTVIDAEKQVSRLYRINAIPQSFFITKEGKIAAYSRGTQNESALRAGIEKALAGKIEEPAIAPQAPKIEKPAIALPAPKLVSPEHLSRFDHYPRKTTLVWEAVPGAAGYRVETDYGWRDEGWASERNGYAHSVDVTTTTYTFNFVGAQPGRWRVCATDARGREGAKSEWRQFFYSR